MLIQKRRSAAKAVLWVLMAAATTITLSLFATTGFSPAEIIALDSGIRGGAYYVYDRVWSKTRFGVRPVRVFIGTSTDSTWDYYPR